MHFEIRFAYPFQILSARLAQISKKLLNVNDIGLGHRATDVGVQLKSWPPFSHLTL